MAGEKRAQDNEDSIIKENVVIVDIEGTTTSISFVKDKLFPYVRENVKKYVDTKWEDEEFKKDLEILKEQAKKDGEDKIEGVVPISGSTVDEEKESLVKNVIWQMDGDRKTTGLKQLQGHMWREAYDSGKMKGHVFEDVPECLKSWKKSGKKIYVYSSGSVEAQKLLFGHSEHGDLLEYFSGHFDTAVGTKQEAASYKNILNQIKTEASDAIFLTDIVKEARAAKEAGLSSIIMIREGNAPLTAEETVEFRTAKSFLDLPFLNPAKRQKLETPEESEKQAAVEPVPEKMEVSEDVEMTDVSRKDSKSKDEAKPQAEGSEEVAEEITTAPEKDEAMETDGKTVEAVEEIRETKREAEETAKMMENETETEEKVEKSKAADETDKAIVADVKETEITVKLVEVSVKKAETEVAIEEKPETVPEIKTGEEKTETKTEGTEEQSEPSKNDKIENQTENGKSDSAETKEVEKKEPKEAESVAEDSEKISEPESKENGTSETDEISKTDTEVKEKAEDSKIAEQAAKETSEKKSKEEEARKEIVATEAKKDEETKEADGEKGKEPEMKDDGKTEITKDVVAEPVKKLNGTTQNGESGKTADDDTKKIHTNGVNEPCTSESSNTNTSKEVSQQNREAEISDSIKVKKVVDSTVADGAGEQDVVTPAVAVAATS